MRGSLRLGSRLGSRGFSTGGSQSSSGYQSWRAQFSAGVVGIVGAGLVVGKLMGSTECKEAKPAPAASRRAIQIFTGTAHPELASEVAGLLGTTVSNADVKKFKCGETAVLINESVRDNDVFVIQPTCNPTPNDYLMELLVMIDAMRRAGAGRITAVVPLYGYSRQDKKDASRAPITGKLVADMMRVAGADRVITVDLHAAQIQGFVTFPIDNLYASPLMLDHIEKNIVRGNPDDVVIVSPDAGGAKRAEKMADSLDTGLAIFSKKRVKANEVASMILVGDVMDKKCILVDDMCDTGGSLVTAANQLVAAGAREVHAAITHGVLSNPALSRITNSPIDQFIVTDTIPMTENKKLCPKLTVLKTAPLIAQAIRRVHEGKSVSYLFDHTPVV